MHVLHGLLAKAYRDTILSLCLSTFDDAVKVDFSTLYMREVGSVLNHDCGPASSEALHFLIM